MISGTGRAANAPPSAPSVHSERLPGRVNESRGMDTPWVGEPRGEPWSGGNVSP
ncbi:hypothetical protein STRTUCAR8_07964 [Streptomyces turgidiscabies Car8]|uniref:Uncharacterized protein n=1 Tax=Streptomyces turgidiscabies (strain Car8) TaxID=698760 RepID=L7F582_STRT8|nr:hypothetical protein STRTUCAR8_07964 [Streptomyces turgidiscabies Car8]